MRNVKYLFLLVGFNCCLLSHTYANLEKLVEEVKIIHQFNTTITKGLWGSPDAMNNQEYRIIRKALLESKYGHSLNNQKPHLLDMMSITKKLEEVINRWYQILDNEIKNLQDNEDTIIKLHEFKETINKLFKQSKTKLKVAIGLVRLTRGDYKRTLERKKSGDFQISCITANSKILKALKRMMEENKKKFDALFDPFDNAFKKIETLKKDIQITTKMLDELKLNE